MTAEAEAEFDHYIAVDWSHSSMAISRATCKRDAIQTFESKSDVGDLRAYLRSLKGKKIIVLEESTSSQWIYVELKDEVDKFFICDPRRNHLLKEGVKTDKIDSVKLVKLLKAGLLKEVYHSTDDYIYLRRLVSSYDDLINTIVRTKNQKSAILKLEGKAKNEELPIETPLFTKFIHEDKLRIISMLEERKKLYEQEFEHCTKKYKELRLLRDIPGIGLIGSVKILSRVVDPRRFKTKGHFLSYCGLVKLERSSGGQIYSRTNSKYSRELKSVFKTAALGCVRTSEGELAQLYNYYLREKALADFDARHAVARHVATVAYGVLKSKKKYQPRMVNT